MLTTIAVIGGLYLSALGTVYVMQRQFIYLPDDRRAMLEPTGETALLHEIEVTAADGTTTLSWYRAPAAPGRPTLVLLHGNAGNIADRLFKIAGFVERGWGAMLVGYRGYGGNPGTPTEAGLYDDARAALAALERRGVGAERTVLYGESLGSGIAVQMALERPAAALVLEAPFTSLADMAQRRFPYFPSRWLVRDRFDSISKIAAVDMPVMVLHGARDPVTPVAFGRRLYEAAAQPKDLKVFPEAGHVDLYEHGAGHEVIAFVERALVENAPAIAAAAAD